jgi:diguanylate cyclase (GGDEF)-like protein
MKKKTREPGSKVAQPGAAKRSKAGRGASSAASGRSKTVKRQPGSKRQPASRPPAMPDDAKPAIRKLRAQLAQAQARIDELQAFADTDFLLDIPNRRGFERELNRSIAFIKRYHARGALIMLDVDRLKPINDTYGHAAGDQVLKAVVGVLLDQVRSSDLIGRLGGDEFALLLWNLSETDARAKAALLEESIDRLSFVFRGHTVTAGVSAGVALLGPHTDAGRALEEADRAMYVRKAQRRHEVK